MDNTLLKLHKEWMETGEIPDFGLCNSIPLRYRSLFKRLMRPRLKEFRGLSSNGESTSYWGSGLQHDDMVIYEEYTPLRQTILLLFHEYINS